VQLQGLDRDALALQLVSATTLDRAQVDALVAGLTREMCLIQGPPGTGMGVLGGSLLAVSSHCMSVS
jgi:hypothetical protein